MNADLRLAIPAVAAWIAAISLVAAPGTALPVSTAAFVGAGALAIVARRSAVAAMAAIVLAAVGVVSIAVGIRATERAPAVLEAALEQHRTAALEIELTATAFAREAPIAATAVSVETPDGVIPVRVAVLVFDAGVAERLAIGTRLELTGTLARTDAGDDVAYLVFATAQAEVTSGPAGLLAITDALRATFVGAATALEGDGAQLLPGLAIGDTSAVGAELDVAMKASSLSHLTAVSGANCAIIVGLVVAFAAWVGAPRTVRVIAALVALAGFVLLVTPEPSVLRAAVMASVVLVALARGRPAAGVAVLAIAVLALLVVDPWLGRNYGFALSVLATAGLLVLARPVAGLLERILPAPLALLVSVPIAAQLACQPVLILLDPILPTYGVVANLLAAPAAPVATIGGLAACLLLPVAEPVGRAILALSWLPSAWIGAVARFFAAAPLARVPWLDGLPGAALLAVLTVFGLWVALAPRKRLAALALGLVATLWLTTSVTAALVRSTDRPGDWQFAACDVGQGDAMVVRSAGAIALVDTGPDPDRLDACLDELGIDRIDLLVLTHFDLDHIGGTEAVVGRVDAAFIGPEPEVDDLGVIDALERGGAIVETVARGRSGTLGDLRFDVLWPPVRLGSVEPGNPASVTMLFRGAGACASGCLSSLLTGDLTARSQGMLIDATTLPHVDVLKVSHHGSADQDPEFITRVAATIGVIGVGAGNTYGHPTADALGMLAAAGTIPVRTDERGLILVSPATDGGVRVWSEREPAASDAAIERQPTPAPVARFRLEAAARRSRSASGRPSRRRAVAAPRKATPAKASAKVAIDQLSWDRIRPAPVVLVSGTEGFLADRAIRSLRELLKSEDPSLEVSDLEADHYGPGELITLASPSLFNEPRMIRVTGVEKCTDAFITETIEYLEHPADDTYLVLRHAGGVRGKRLLDAIRAGSGGGIEIVCTELKNDTDKTQFAAAEFAAAGRRVTGNAIRALVSAFSDDLAELAAACQQLLADASEEITEVTVEKYYSGRVETNAFKVADSAIAGRRGEALILLRHAISSGADPVPIVAAFAAKVRAMAKVAGARGSSMELAQRFGLAPWQVDRAKRDVQGWSDEGLGRTIELLAETDAQVKGGGRDPVYALERMVAVIANRGEPVA